MIRKLLLLMLLPLTAFASLEQPESPPFLTIDEARDYYAKRLEAAPGKIEAYYSKYSADEMQQLRDLKNIPANVFDENIFIPINSEVILPILQIVFNEKRQHTLAEFKMASIHILKLSQTDLPKLTSSICDDESSSLCQSAITIIKSLKYYGFDNGNVTYSFLDKDTFEVKPVISAVNTDFYRSLYPKYMNKDGPWLSFIVLSNSKVKFFASDLIAENNEFGLEEGNVYNVVTKIANLDYNKDDVVTPCAEAFDLLSYASRSINLAATMYPNGVAKNILDKWSSPVKSLRKCELLVTAFCNNMYSINRESLAVSYMTQSCVVRDIVKEEHRSRP